MSSITCVKIVDSSDLYGILKDVGQDFWMGTLVDVDTDDFPDKVQSIRVDDMLLIDVFTHCYYCKASDVREEANAIFQRVGLGLRKSQARSSNMSGVLYCCINKTGPSVLFQQQEERSATDKKLSAEARLRKTTMEMHIVPLEHMIKEGSRNRSSFWLTSWSSCSSEEAKKRVVCMNVEGQCVQDRFKMALITDVSNCSESSQKVMGVCGLGLRASAVRARATSGVVAMLLTGEGTAFLPPPAQSARATAGAIADAEPGHAEKKRRLENAAQAAAVNATPRPPMLPLGDKSPSAKNSSSRQLPSAAKGEVDEETAQEELHYRSVRLIEKKLAVLLPTLPKDQLNTTFVMHKLEDTMQKPRGRLLKWRLDIARIWRSYLDNASSDE